MPHIQHDSGLLGLQCDKICTTGTDPESALKDAFKMFDEEGTGQLDET